MIRPAAVNAAAAVAGDENKRNVRGLQALSHRIGRLAGEIDVDDRNTGTVIVQKRQRVGDVRRVPYGRRAEIEQHVFDDKDRRTVVLDEEDFKPGERWPRRAGGGISERHASGNTSGTART